MACPHWLGLVSTSPRFCRRRAPLSRYRTCSIARSAARTIVTCSTIGCSRDGVARVGPAWPADPVPSAAAMVAPRRTARGRQLAAIENWQVAARGRAASPTKAGGNIQYLRGHFVFAGVRTGSYPLSYPVIGGEDYRTALLSDSPKQNRRPLNCIPPFSKKCIPVLGIFYMGIIKCIFLYRVTGEICRSVGATIAVPDRRNLPVRCGDVTSS